MRFESSFTKDVARIGDVSVDRADVKYALAKTTRVPILARIGKTIAAASALTSPIHVAHPGKQVLLCMGEKSLGDVEQALAGKSPRLTAVPEFREALARLPEQPWGVGYVSPGRLGNGIVALARRLDKSFERALSKVSFKPGPAIGMTMVRSGSGSLVDVWVPAGGVRVLVDGIKAAKGPKPARDRAHGIPQWVLDTKVPLITAKKPYRTKRFRQGDVMDVEIDMKTGYRRIKNELWAGVMTCASCGKKIPVKPYEVTPVEPGQRPPTKQEHYTCPLCGREALPKED